MARKWIIEEGLLKLGNVTLHRDLCKDPQKVEGGGYWEYNQAQSKMFFYGKSEDFGQVTQQQWRDADKSRADFIMRRCEDCILIFTTDLSL